MSEEIKLIWGVEDGYAGKDRPQTSYIDMDELLDSCDTTKQAEEYLSEFIQEEFLNSICWYCDFSEALAKFDELKAKRKEEERDV